jgi:hypothetical protein
MRYASNLAVRSCCAGGRGGRGGRPARAEVDTMKFYTLLGVEKTATEAEIKKVRRHASSTREQGR